MKLKACWDWKSDDGWQWRDPWWCWSVHGALSISFHVHVLSSLKPPEGICQNGSAIWPKRNLCSDFLPFLNIPWLFRRCHVHSSVSPAPPKRKKKRNSNVQSDHCEHICFVFKQLILYSAMKICKFPVGLALSIFFPLFHFFCLFQDKPNESIQNVLDMEVWAQSS